VKGNCPLGGPRCHQAICDCFDHLPDAPEPFPDVRVRSRAWFAAQEGRRRQESQAATAYPPPTVPKTETDPAADFVPRGVRATWNQVAKAGWQARLTRAIGPRIGSSGKVISPTASTLVIAAQSPQGARLSWEWLWHPERNEWKFVEALDHRAGRVLTSTEAKGML